MWLPHPTPSAVSSPTAMPLRTPPLREATGAGMGGGRGVSSFKTQATPSPSSVKPAPPALRTRPGWPFPPPRRRRSQLSVTIDVLNPPRSRRAACPGPPSAPKRMTPRSPSPLRLPNILPAESWGWGCGHPQSCCSGVC